MTEINRDRQRCFDFHAVATDSRRAELASLLRGIGLIEAEIRIMVYVWANGRLIDNRSAVIISLRRLARAIGYSRNWTMEARDNLVAFGVLEDQSRGKGRPMAYMADWTKVRTAEPVRNPDACDPFACFETGTPTGTPTGTQGVPESVPPSVPEGGPPGGTPQSQNLNQNLSSKR